MTSKRTNAPKTLEAKRRKQLRFYTQLLEHVVEDLSLGEDELVQHLLGAIRSRSFKTVVEVAKRVGAQAYANYPDSFDVRYAQLAALVRKVPFTGADLDPESTTWRQFIASEHVCKRTNQRLLAERNAIRENRPSAGRRNRYHRIRQLARGYILRVLGHKPNLRDVYDCSGFGPGVTIGCSGDRTNWARKLSASAITVTPSALPYARSAYIADFHIREHLSGISHEADLSNKPLQAGADIIDRVNAACRVFDDRACMVGYDKIAMVPKQADKLRTSASQPTLNAYLQSGTDSVMRALMQPHGFDLKMDQEKHAALALQGSLGGFDPVVTLDLSDASSCIAIQAVKDLYPVDWYWFLMDIRTPAWKYKQESGRYEKFCAMGNGFCFPLESLMFGALAYGCCVETGNRMFSVYGDDIIVRQSSALLLIEVLRYFGFKVNRDKTFITGPFRESCGADYFGGVNVRPYYLDFLPTTLADMFKVFNGLRKSPCDMSETRAFVMASVKPKNRLVSPFEGPPDAAFHLPLDEARASEFVSWDKVAQCYRWTELLTVPVTDDIPQTTGIQTYGAIRGLPRSKESGRPAYTVRRQTTSVRVQRMGWGSVDDQPPKWGLKDRRE